MNRCKTMVAIAGLIGLALYQDAWSHGDGMCIRFSDGTQLTISHFTPTGSDDPSRNPDPRYAGGHGHLKKHNGRLHSWGYWTQAGYEYVQQRIEYYRQNGGEARVSREFGWVSCSTVTESALETEPIIDGRDDAHDTVPEPVEPEPIVEGLDDARDTVSDDVEVPEPVEPEPDAETERFSYQFYGGFNFMGFHSIPDVTTVAQLWNRWLFLQDSIIFLHIDGQWLKYSGQPGQDTGDIPITPYMALVIYLEKGATWLGYEGVRSPARNVIELNAGSNLVAFPEVREGYERPSDFLSDTVCAVVRTVQPNKCPDGWCDNFKLIGRAGDPGDVPLVDGDALLMIAAQATTIQLSASAAPMAPRAKTLTTGWGTMKQQ